MAFKPIMEDFQPIEIDLGVASLLAETKPPGGFCLVESLELAAVRTHVSLA